MVTEDEITGTTILVVAIKNVKITTTMVITAIMNTAMITQKYRHVHCDKRDFVPERDNGNITIF